MDLLRTFYNDIHTRETFKEFQLNLLRQMAVDRVFDKEDIAGIHEAKQIIEDSFSRLEEMYGAKEKKEPDSPR